MKHINMPQSDYFLCQRMNAIEQKRSLGTMATFSAVSSARGQIIRTKESSLSAWVLRLRHRPRCEDVSTA
jgi:hypothetical protein